MAYNPTTWNTGDTITASALNKIENGIANAGGASWDAIIHLTHANNSDYDSPSSLTPSIVEGSFDSLHSKLTNNEYPCILVEYQSLFSPTVRFSSPMAYVVYFSDAGINLQINGYSPTANAYTSYGVLTWLVNDALEWF